MALFESKDFRDLSENESYDAPDAIEGPDLTLRHSETKMFTKSSVPSFHFDMMNKEDEKVGSVYLIAEPDDEKVRHCGHYCGDVIEGEDYVKLIGTAATMLQEFAKSKGVDSMRYVVKKGTEAEEACRQIGATEIEDKISNTWESLLVFKQ